MNKKNLYIFSLLALLVSCSGNQQKAAKPASDKPKTEAVRPRVRKTIPTIKEFSYITSLSGMNIVYTQGDYNIEAEGDSALINYLRTDFDSQILTLSIQGEANADLNLLEGKVDITLYISSPHLDCVSLCGSGNFTQKGTLRSNNFQMGLMGKGNIVCDTIIAPALRFECSQPGSASFGRIVTNDMLIYNRASSTFKADIDCGLLNVINTTSGTVTLSGYAKEKHVTNSGNGKVTCTWDQFVSK
ncbi:MAG: DUF2807 domain-containing protein [Bacteroidaceae bacterium]|nr:DUF2807 domain-containing protein [Bacteroidaceae bacterium]